MSKKLLLQDIYNKFLKEGCECLETEYFNNSTPMRYKCICGNISKIAFKSFKNGHRCRACGIKKGHDKQKNSQEYINQQFRDLGHECLGVYIGYNKKIKYKCKCGNVSYAQFGNIVKGQNCMKCGKNKIYTQDDVNRIFKDAGCECLDIYKNSITPIKYRCSCGYISHIRFDTFQQGGRCKKCAIKRNSGENHPNWIEDRNKIRSMYELHSLSATPKRKFRKKYKISKNLVIDHIQPIIAFVDYKIYNLEIINAEDNLRAITREENLAKGGRYDRQLFENYINKKVQI